MLLPAGLVAKLLLKRYQLLCETVLAASCCFTFESSTMQKPSCYEAFQTKPSQRTPKIINNKRRTKKQGICDNFAKNVTKKRQTKYRNIVFFTKTSKTTQKSRFSSFLTKKPPKNKRDTPCGGRRTRHLVVAAGSEYVCLRGGCVDFRPAKCQNLAGLLCRYSPCCQRDRETSSIFALQGFLQQRY